ncbi:MAG: hypothetical protein J6R75_04155 [Candidatus Methanomethylophilaceae archaeon]|nr:hypothetical protein [Candidatus Methanomethylophilaceae archaeon]
MADNNPDCKCPGDCPRHGNCRECVAFHLDGGKKPPFCLRVKWTEYQAPQ